MIVKVNWNDTRALCASIDAIRKARKQAEGRSAMLLSFSAVEDDSIIEAGIFEYLRKIGYKDMYIEFFSSEANKRYSVFVFGKDVQGVSVDRWFYTIIAKAETCISLLENKKIAEAWEMFAKKHLLNDWDDTFKERFFDYAYENAKVGYFNVVFDDAAALKAVTQREQMTEEGVLW